MLVRWAESDAVPEGHRYSAIPVCDGAAMPGGHLDFCSANIQGERMRAALLPRIVEYFRRHIPAR